MKRRAFVVLTLVFALAALALPLAAPAQRISAHESGVHLRVAHLAPAAPAVDVYLNDRKAVENLAYKGVTEYLPLQGTLFKVVVVPTGGNPATDSVTEQPVMLTFAADDRGYYTVAAVGSPADGSFALILLPADGPQTPANVAGGMVGSAEAGTLKVTGAFARATKKADSMGGMDHGHGGHGGAATAEPTPKAMGGSHMGAMSGVSAVYMTIANTGDRPDRLLSAATEVAGLVELHETKVENDIARMEAIPGGIEIPAGGMVELKPGGKHIMLLELKQDLVAGSTIRVTLTFESGATLTVIVPVVAP